MAVLLETTVGDIVVDLNVDQSPQLAANFLKLCKLKFYNFSAFHRVERDFCAQTGDPFEDGGRCVANLIDPHASRYVRTTAHPRLKHVRVGTVAMACTPVDSNGTMTTTTTGGNDTATLACGSQFYITLAPHLDYLDGRHAVFGQVTEGLDVLERMAQTYVDDQFRPFTDIRIRHTVVLDDPFPDPTGLHAPSKSPLPTPAQLATVRIGEGEQLDPGLDPEELERLRRQKEAAAQALTLEILGDVPFAEAKPPENVLFVCKLNPVTRDEDLELIFSRFGTIASCEVIRDKKTGDSLQYAFIEFERREEAEEAYFKMDNVLIDERRIHVDFSQSVAKLHREWNVVRGSRDADHGGDDLVTKRKYRADGSRLREEEGYEMVFEEQGRTEETKRIRTRSSPPRRVQDTSIHQHRRNNDDEDDGRRRDHHRRDRSLSPILRYRPDRDERSSGSYRERHHRRHD